MFHLGCTEITVLFYSICHYRKDKDDNGKPEAFQQLEKRTKYHYSILKDGSEEGFISHLLWAGKHTLMCKRQCPGLQFLKKQAGELKGCSPTKRFIQTSQFKSLSIFFCSFFKLNRWVSSIYVLISIKQTVLPHTPFRIPQIKTNIYFLQLPLLNPPAKISIISLSLHILLRQK